MRTRRRIALMIPSLLVGLAALIGCGGYSAPGTAAPAPSPAPAPAPAPTPASRYPPGVGPSDPVLQAFLNACEQGVGKWTTGQVDHPDQLTLDLGQSRSYRAAVDIRTSPLPPNQVLASQDARAAPVSVQCVVSARLVSVGAGVEVDPRDFVAQRFTPDGVVEWAWSITAAELGDSELRLELRPAVTSPGPAGGALEGVGGALPLKSFVSSVEVRGTLLQRVWHWLDENKAAVGGIAALVAGAVLAVLRFGGDLGEAWLTARGKWRPDRAEPRPVPSPRSVAGLTPRRGGRRRPTDKP